MAERHISASIEGLLKLSNKTLSRMFTNRGRKLTAIEVRDEMRERISKGEIYIKAERCNNFSPKRGCLCHER